ncbi:MAG: 4-hydroxy-tetrahydrodipicolinate reductase [Dehalococcoidia bacterium]
MSIKVAIHGAAGRMGQEVLKALCADPDLDPVAGVDQGVAQGFLPLPDGSGQIPFSSDPDSIFTQCQPQVVVDFSVAEATRALVPVAARHRVNLVIGTTGLTQADLDEIESLALSHDIGAVVAPNFALGAVVLIYLAKIAARYFDYAEITELHHHLKIDAPSGTALATARAMVEGRGRPFEYPRAEKETLKGTRGGEDGGIAIHSVRLPGLLAHQEVILGGPGQTLSLRHDTISRECFIPGVLLAVKEVTGRKGLVYGLDTLLGLSGAS